MMRYINMKPNSKQIKECIYNGTYLHKSVTYPSKPEYGDTPAQPHSEDINVHDVESKLVWEIRKFTSKDGESLESYYMRFYKMLNELHHQSEVNEIQAERLDKTTNPLALVAVGNGVGGLLLKGVGGLLLGGGWWWPMAVEVEVVGEDDDIGC
ncbi:hypothetical protein Tco_0722155 [Tanacetum coccineum]